LGADTDPGLLSGADMRLSLGSMTWPHALARVLLVEQIYRAQQIASGHPYHRE
jgi:23S rRNA (pseudouridine1915-N3)-methyltransferase